MGAVIDNL